MARQPLTLLLITLLLASATYTSLAATDDDAKVAELVALQAKSGTGVIKLNSDTFEKYAGGRERSYSLLIIADAKQFRNQGKLQLGKLFRDYATVAKSFARKHADKPTARKVFFTSIEYSENKEAFGSLGIPGLPYLGRLPPSHYVKPAGASALPDEETMRLAEYPWGIQSIAEFVEERTGLSAGDFSDPTQERSRFLPVITLIVVGGLIHIGLQLYKAPFMRDVTIYGAGALFIMWFSVSGTMYNIIRGVPMVGYDPRSKQSMLFMPGQGQLGAEGFIMGSFYTLFGLIVAFYTRLLPTIKDDHKRRVIGYALLGAAFVVLRWVMGLHGWKTGMRTSWYL